MDAVNNENTKKSKENVYKKNTAYDQEEITKLVKIYHMALAAGDDAIVQDAFTQIHNFIEKFVYNTLWSNYRTLMQNRYHREDIIQDVWVKIFSVTTFTNDWLIVLCSVDTAVSVIFVATAFFFSFS